MFFVLFKIICSLNGFHNTKQIQIHLYHYSYSDILLQFQAMVKMVNKSLLKPVKLSKILVKNVLFLKQ